MKSCRPNINAFFCTLALLCLFTACKTTEEKKEAKQQTLVKVFVEVPRGDKSDEAEVPVYRQHPVNIRIDTKELLNNIDIKGASIVDIEGGYGMRITFDEHGARVLENVTARNAGKHLVIYAAWPEIRWLAAPRITRRIANGELVFTPDATREECEKIVLGINNVAKKVNKERWPQEPKP
jgi:preprotein translocase subunit SecD